MLCHVLTIIAAPDGFGKSTSLSKYLKKEKKQNIWINTRKESDFALLWSEVIKQSTNAYIPEELVDINLFRCAKDLSAYIEKWDLYLTDDLFIVIDDFHKLKPSTFVDFLMALSQCQSKHLHFVLVGQYVENARLRKLLDQKLCYTLSIQDFQLDLYDLIRYCKQRDISIEKEKLVLLLQYTKGWIPAIDLALSALLEGKSVFSATKIKTLMAKAKIEDINDDDIVALIKLSYLDDFEISQMYFICEYNQIERLIKKLSYSDLFLQKKDFRRYAFTDIFKAYLYEAQLDYQIDVEKTYHRIADWYIDSGDFEKAVLCLLKSRDYEKALYLIREEVFRSVDLNVSFLDEVFHKLPIQYRFDNPHLYLYFIKMVIVYSDQIRGKRLLESFRLEVENNKFIGDKDNLVNEYYFVRAFTKFNDFFAMMSDFHLALNNSQNTYLHGVFPQIALTYGSYQILYLYHHQVGQLQMLLKAIQREANTLIQLSGGVNSGIDYLVQAEYFYIIGRYENVASLAETAYKVSYVNKRTSVCIASVFLIARYALRVDELDLFQNKVDELVKLRSQVTSAILEKQIDCALSHLYILNGHLDGVVDWIKEGRIEAFSMMYETQGLPHLCHMLYLLKSGKYKEAESCCDMIDYENQQIQHVFATIYAKLSKVIVYFHTNRMGKSILMLKELFEMTEKDKVKSIFVEFHDELLPIVKRYKCENDFELNVVRMIQNRNIEIRESSEHIFDVLSSREREVANLYIEAYTAQEIADMLVISYNTVLSHLKIIYSKLGVNKKKELMQLVNSQNIY